MVLNHNQLVIHTRVITISIVLGVCVTITFARLIGRNYNHINKTWDNLHHVIRKDKCVHSDGAVKPDLSW